MSWFFLGPKLAKPPERIVSLVPSLTEAVSMLGRGHLLIGRTDFCVSPGQVRTVTSVGGTKTVDFAKVIQLRPDLVLAAKEENPKAVVQNLSQSIPVLVVDPQGPQDVPELWRILGEVLGAEDRGRELAAEVERELQLTTGRTGGQGAHGSFLYFVWSNPWMAAGPATYVGRLLARCGLVNALAPGSRRYPVISQEQALGKSVTLHLYPDEPFAFRLPDALAAWGLPFVPLSLPPAPAGEAAARGFEDRCSAPDEVFLLAGRILCVPVAGADLTWYPSRTQRGLSLARQLARMALGIFFGSDG
ncbi:MAG: ABC transporter substrate-binding protein [Thermoanaerobaculaceae bacterium]